MALSSAQVAGSAATHQDEEGRDSLNTEKGSDTGHKGKKSHALHSPKPLGSFLLPLPTQNHCLGK